MPKLDAGRSLDALVAEKVFGHILARERRLNGAILIVDSKGRPGSPVPPYSTDLAAAFSVIAHLYADGWHWEVSDSDEDVVVEFMRGGYDGYNDEWDVERSSAGDTVPLAICRAALATLEEQS